jgi:lipopolysaccharide/colanic/teichoic acid biosynthesis glycosyltransferase
MLQALVDCQETGAEVVRMSTIYERFLERIPIDHLEPDWVFTSLVDAMRFRDTSSLAKRAADIVGGLVGTVIFLLVIPIIGPAIWLTGGGPILFRQVRVGRDNKPFHLIKFRTMVAAAERDGPRWAGVKDGRVTPFGRILRRSRLDEIPQFLNVLKGDMSLVGPRPERPEFVEELSGLIPFYRARLMVRPGLTGWAQVNYRYGDSVADAAVKLEYDLYYIKHRSMLFDLLVGALTVKTVLMFSGR